MESRIPCGRPATPTGPYIRSTGPASPGERPAQPTGPGVRPAQPTGPSVRPAQPLLPGSIRFSPPVLVGRPPTPTGPYIRSTGPTSSDRASGPEPPALESVRVNPPVRLCVRLSPLLPGCPPAQPAGPWPSDAARSMHSFHRTHQPSVRPAQPAGSSVRPAAPGQAARRSEPLPLASINLKNRLVVKKNRSSSSPTGTSPQIAPPGRSGIILRRKLKVSPVPTINPDHGEKKKTATSKNESGHCGEMSLTHLISGSIAHEIPGHTRGRNRQILPHEIRVKPAADRVAS